MNIIRHNIKKLLLFISIWLLFLTHFVYFLRTWESLRYFRALHSFDMSDNCLTLDSANLSKLRWKGCVIVLIQNVYNYIVVIKINEHKHYTYTVPLFLMMMILRHTYQHKIWHKPVQTLCEKNIHNRISHHIKLN